MTELKYQIYGNLWLALVWSNQSEFTKPVDYTATHYPYFWVRITEAS